MTPNAGQRKGLLASARGTKEPKRPAKYRRGGVNNSGASLQPPRPDVNAGRQASESAKFLGQMQEMIFGKGMLHEQYREAEKEKGIAQFEKANSEQREGFRDAINNGWIDNKESPYFREGVTVSHTKNLLTKTSLDLYTEYEKWEGKNDPSSGAFDKWLETQDEKIAINLENIPDNILANNFYEPHQAIKRQLAQQHAGHLNKEYRDKANVQADLRFNGLIKQYSQAMGLDLGSDPNKSIPELLKEHGINQDRVWRVATLLKEVPTTGPNQGVMPKDTLSRLELMASNEGGVAASTLWEYNGTDVETLRYSNEDVVIPWEQSKLGQLINAESMRVTPEANANTIGEFQRSYSEHDNVVLQQQAEDFHNVMTVTATMPEGAMRDVEPAPEGLNARMKRQYLERKAGREKEYAGFGGKTTPIKVTRLSDSMKRELNPKTFVQPVITKTETDVKNTSLASGAGGNSETMVDIVMQEGMKGGAHEKWFNNINNTMSKDTLLTISHDFFDMHHAGLLNKKKGAWEGRRTVTSKFKTTKVNQTTFVSFVKNHLLNKGTK